MKAPQQISQTMPDKELAAWTSRVSIETPHYEGKDDSHRAESSEILPKAVRQDAISSSRMIKKKRRELTLQSFAAKGTPDLRNIELFPDYTLMIDRLHRRRVKGSFLQFP
ncbi:uncharacterized protein PHALS_03266 [Plasmopara halstedii]|uniref:Uncharacterized protein n=1 Tax=Plasmopara halstedii TaxID=4781 RepID=A0A0N7L7C1_PLAHL|nr:uncharacterized protein PHALS_03266 [Plasmopara halstedii]CEG46659.1 hypothetical protein PHALS_03266 [Plasmopara halstedii]|eukprot:XP_024583028.1 hypothetical protein PHALS_03266 [Plasmopara halstedii]